MSVVLNVDPRKTKNPKVTIIVLSVFFVFGIYLCLHMSASYRTAYNAAAAKDAQVAQQTSVISFGGTSQAVSSGRSETSKLNMSNLMMKGIGEAFTNPGHIWPIGIEFFGALLLYALIEFIIAGFCMTQKEERAHDLAGKEQGSAQFLKSLKNYNKQYTLPYESEKDPYDKNVILSKDMKLGLDNHFTGRNLNSLVIGGSGAGKTFRYIKPNMAQMNSSCIVTDPSGELMRCMGKMLINRGVNVKVFSTSDMKHSNCYNPIDYCYSNGKPSEENVATMVNIYLKNVKGKGAGKGDPFWDSSSSAFISALVWYMIEVTDETYPEKRDPSFRSFYNILTLTQAAKVDEESAESESELDILMNRHCQIMKNIGKSSHAQSFYSTFKLAPAKTANSILISVAVDLQKFFENTEVRNLTRHDYDNERNNVNLDLVGDEQTYLFINIPQANDTFNFLVAMMYSQMFQSLYSRIEHVTPEKWMIANKFGDPVISMIDSEKEAEEYLKVLQEGDIKVTTTSRGASYYGLRYGKKIIIEKTAEEPLKKIIKDSGDYKIVKQGLHSPWHIRCLLDEFANIGEIPNFEMYLATMRKYEISCAIVLQSIAQLKEKYEKSWEGLVGNCDTLIFLGSTEYETTKYISDLLGETTIKTKNMSRSYGRTGSTSESTQYTKRQLMTPQEVGNINNSRGNKPLNRCIVRVRDVDVYLGDKYDFTKHSNFKYTGDFDRNNAVDSQYMDIYFNTEPAKKKKTGKMKARPNGVKSTGGQARKYSQEEFNEAVENGKINMDNAVISTDEESIRKAEAFVNDYVSSHQSDFHSSANTGSSAQSSGTPTDTSSSSAASGSSSKSRLTSPFVDGSESAGLSENCFMF